MNISRTQLFSEAWTVARRYVAKGMAARAAFARALRFVWPAIKEAARKAALPARPNAYSKGAPAFIHADQFGWSVRSSRTTPISNNW